MPLLHEDLTKQIIGALYKVYNSLGFGYKEKEYQKAFAIELERIKLEYQRELYSVLKYEDQVIAKFFVDFLVSGLVVVELKVATDFHLQYRQQVIQYLKNHGLRIGILAIITPQKVLIKRFIN
jgi:GxxExxY protein